MKMMYEVVFDNGKEKLKLTLQEKDGDELVEGVIDDNMVVNEIKRTFYWIKMFIPINTMLEKIKKSQE